MSDIDAIIGGWYQVLGGQTFEVVAIDGGCIEIQHFEGDIEEIDAEAWREMPLILVEPPEDWTGVYDNIESDDLGYSDTTVQPEGWVVVAAIADSYQ